MGLSITKPFVVFYWLKLLFLLFLFQILGVIILALGIYLQISEASNYMNVLPNIKFTTPVSLIVAAGIITMVVAILGFCAAVMESRCLMVVVSKTV